MKSAKSITELQLRPFNPIFLKFIYSEKAIKFCKISAVVTVKSTAEISQNFVAFSEYMNFKSLDENYRQHETDRSFHWSFHLFFVCLCRLSSRLAHPWWWLCLLSEIRQSTRKLFSRLKNSEIFEFWRDLLYFLKKTALVINTIIGSKFS